MATITRWILRHRLLVAAFWIVVAIASLASSGSAAKALSPGGSIPPGYEGVDTNNAILHTYGADGGASPLVPVIILPQGTTVATPGVKARLTAALGAVQAAAPGARVASYASTGDRAFVSSDGRTTFALVYPAVHPGQAPPVAAVQRALAAHPIAGARVYVTGRDALASAPSPSSGTSGVLAETLIGGLGALVILTMDTANGPAVCGRPGRAAWYGGAGSRRASPCSSWARCCSPSAASCLATLPWTRWPPQARVQHTRACARWRRPVSAAACLILSRSCPPHAPPPRWPRAWPM